MIENMSNASIEATLDLNYGKVMLDLCDSTEGARNSMHLPNLLDAVRDRPGSVDQIHHRDACVHCCSPGITILSN